MAALPGRDRRQDLKSVFLQLEATHKYGSEFAADLRLLSTDLGRFRGAIAGSRLGRKLLGAGGQDRELRRLARHGLPRGLARRLQRIGVPRATLKHYAALFRARRHDDSTAILATAFNTQLLTYGADLQSYLNQLPS